MSKTHQSRSSHSTATGSRAGSRGASPVAQHDWSLSPAGCLAMQGTCGNAFVQEMISRKASGDVAGDPGAAFTSATRGTRMALPHQESMEDLFDADFSDVEVHVGNASAMDALGAHAAACGSQVVFEDANPDPQLVAHELTHVVQQSEGAGSVQAKGRVSQPGDAAEREADAVAARVAGGQAAGEVSAVGDGIHLDEREKPLLDGFDIMDIGLTPLEVLCEAAPGLTPGVAVDPVAGAMARQAGGTLGILGGLVGITEGVVGIHDILTNDKDENAADVIPNVTHLASGGLATAGGIGAMAGAEGLAALGPLGAAIAVGGFLGKHAGEYAWEQTQKAHAGPKTEELQESYTMPEERALFNVLEGNWGKVLGSKHLW